MDFFNSLNKYNKILNNIPVQLKNLILSFEMNFNDVSRCSKNFERDAYKGGRGTLAPRPPL